jgi:hypothetical protein
MGRLAMIALAWILLAAAPARVELVNEVYSIPSGEWRYIELGLRQRAAYVSASFEAMEGSRQLRLALMRREDVEHLRNGMPHGVMAVTPAGDSGRLGHHAGVPGDYVLVVDNLANTAAKVHLRVTLDFAGHDGEGVRELSWQKQLTVVLISLAVFFGIVSWSAQRLLRAWK